MLDVATDVLASVSTVVLTAWLAATIFSQLPDEALGRIPGRLKRRDHCGVLPLWTFFAPIPGTTDYHLLFRERLADGQKSPWREVLLCGERRWTRWIWNPRKRCEKALTDIVASLSRLSIDRPHPVTLKLSLPYLVLLEFISALPRSALVEARQFMVMETSGITPSRPAVMLFVSEWHRLDPRADAELHAPTPSAAHALNRLHRNQILRGS